MYEHQRRHARLGQIHKANVNVFGSGRSRLPARAPSPVVGIEACATGNCHPYSMGTALAPGASPEEIARHEQGMLEMQQNFAWHRKYGPWIRYAVIGALVGAGYLFLRKSRMVRNPLDLTNPAVIRQAAAITIQAGIPTILWGPPGIGKTEWIRGLGKAMAPMNGDKPVKIITVIGSTKDPTDIGGMPALKGGTWAPPWVKELRQRSDRGLRSILFLDEFSSITPIVHAALLRVVNEKIAADVDFDPKSGPLKGHAVHIVMAANRKEHGAGASDLPPPSANRIIHFNWPKPTIREWIKGMLDRWENPFRYILPADWRSSPLAREALEKVAAFVSYREGVKHQPILLAVPPFDAMSEEHSGRQTSGPWPSPRSWDLAAQALGACLVAGAPEDVQITAIEGAVGVGAAIEMFTYKRFEDLPDPEEILQSPNDWDVPVDDAVKLFIVTNSIANAVARDFSAQRYEDAFRALIHAYDETNDMANLVIPIGHLSKTTTIPTNREILGDTYIPPAFIDEFFARVTPDLQAMGWL